MPTKTRKVGDKTLYDEVGKLDEDLPEEPGYSNKGCSAALIVLCLCVLIIV